MTIAEKYIQQQREKYPNSKEPDISFFESEPFKYLMEAGMTKDMVSKLSSQDLAIHLLDFILPFLPEKIVNLLDSKRLQVAEIQNFKINAELKILGDNNYAIIFSTELSKFLYRIIRVLSTRFDINQEGTYLEFNDFLINLTEVIWYYNETGRAIGPDYFISKQQMNFANKLTTSSELFFLSHEFGHLFNILEKSVEIQEKEDETFADNFALDTLLKAPLIFEYYEPEFLYAGIELGIQIYRFMDDLGIEFEDTHPKSQERLNSIREYLSCNYDPEFVSKVTTISSVIDIYINNLIETLNDSSNTIHIHFEKVAKNIMQQMNNVLDSCVSPKDGIPNYSLYYPKLVKIFNGHYPALFREEVRRITEEFHNAQKKIDSKQISIKGWCYYFQRYKLLNGYIFFNMHEGLLKERLLEIMSNSIIP
jgi:hypothetical protein